MLKVRYADKAGFAVRVTKDRFPNVVLAANGTKSVKLSSVNYLASGA